LKLECEKRPTASSGLGEWLGDDSKLKQPGFAVGQNALLDPGVSFLIGDVLHYIFKVAIKCLTYFAEYIGLDILAFGEFRYRSGGDTSSFYQFLFVHVFINQELPEFFVTDHIIFLTF